MGYFMRYLVAEARLVTTADVRGAFPADHRYSFEEFEGEMLVHHADQPLAHVTMSLPGDEIFDDEIKELMDEARDARGRRRREVLAALQVTKQIVAVQVLHGSRDMESMFALLDPLWDWLEANRAGLLQADGEGYYHGGRLLLRVE